GKGCRDSIGKFGSHFCRAAFGHGNGGKTGDRRADRERQCVPPGRQSVDGKISPAFRIERGGGEVSSARIKCPGGRFRPAPPGYSRGKRDFVASSRCKINV